MIKFQKKQVKKFTKLFLFKILKQRYVAQWFWFKDYCCGSGMELFNLRVTRNITFYNSFNSMQCNLLKGRISTVSYHLEISFIIRKHFRNWQLLKHFTNSYEMFNNMKGTQLCLGVLHSLWKSIHSTLNFKLIWGKPVNDFLRHDLDKTHINVLFYKNSNKGVFENLFDYKSSCYFFLKRSWYWL